MLLDGSSAGGRRLGFQYLWLYVIAGTGVVLTLGQIGALLFMDKVICLNDGCAVVERMVNIPPLWLNGLGAAYFSALLVILFSSGRRPEESGLSVLKIMLLLGMVAEGVLFSYQAFVVRTFCSYCLLVAAVVFLLNIIMGWRQLMLAGSLVGVEVLLFALLHFQIPERELTALSINNGTYGVIQCSKPVKQLYLLFSGDCSHCREVLHSLEKCSRCEVRLNPVQKFDDQPIDGIQRIASYSPEVNRRLLKILGIQTVPVLIEKDYAGLTFIRGTQNIETYLYRNCFAESQIRESGFDLSRFSPSEDDECTVGKECEEHSTQGEIPILQHP